MAQVTSNMENRKTNVVQRLLFGGSRYIMLIVVALVLGVVFTIINPNFLGVDNGFQNIFNLIRQTAVIAIVSCGMTYVILTGGIDLSVGGILVFAGTVGIMAYNALGENALVAIAVTLLAAVLMGMLNGFFIGKLKLTAFIVTLATQSVARGLALLLTGGLSLPISDPVYKYLGQGDIISIGKVGVPFVLVIMIVIFVIGTIINDKTRFGRDVYAVGGNVTAARAMGINVPKRIIQVYGISGLMAGIGAVLTVGRLSSAQPQAGINLEFDAITAVILGGTSLVGGIGNLKGTIIGAILVGIITNGMGIIPDVTPFATYVVKGLLVLGAVLLDTMSTNYKAKLMVPEIEDTEEFDQEEPAEDGFRQAVASVHGNEAENILEMRSITKVFPGTKALDKVSVTFRQGEVHALMGENGAGKSTLMKILAGEMRQDGGTVYLNGIPVSIGTTFRSQELGVSIIHQEFSLIDELTVAQNIFLGQEIRTGGFVNTRAMEKEAQKVVDGMGLDIDVRRSVKNLTVGEKQMVEIAKALKVKAWLIIMDEPTSALTEDEKEYLFNVIRNLKAKGVSVVYISHRMQEIFDICETITVLRDGQYIGSAKVNEIDEPQLIKMMVGRELSNIFSRERNQLGKTVLRVENLSRDGVFENISFEVREGEVLGFSGLLGAGRTEIARCLFGLDQYDAGRIYLDGKEITIKNSADAIRKGIFYLPEDRKQEGFIPFMSIRENLAFPSYPVISNKLGVISEKEESRISQDQVRALKIKCAGDKQNVGELSGGNQQKVSFGKWMPLDAKVLILDEPTRGIDVSAKAEIHQIIASIARQGVAVILISSEMPELLGAIDNVIVLREGVIRGFFSADEVTQDLIMERQAHTAS
ncbi:ATP-binding cassette domain-containing protein [Christensenella tenuis]|uniref:ATP-binding cassette domain-containing protein n=1 Tax=Christensenella tenuis TaxID=2763033 RepID=A0ABR7EFJ6_9FIRM|nr:ATP-binding cassette domain-containing protein [Christensenella tenuis]MBC5648540.1 ATP-binding cassette domain-containing protein [Christensenella tenuis]